MSKAKKISLILLSVLGLFAVAVGILIATFDINAYRADIADMLSKQSGRTVQLKGPVKLSLSSTGGLAVIVQDVAISNPSWASRSQMAGIGKLELGVELFPLLHHQLTVSQVRLSNADIQLETSSSNQHNWDMKPAESGKPASSPPATTSNTAAKSADQAVTISVEKINISDSQMTLRDKTGKASVFKVKSAKLDQKSGGVSFSFDGEYNGAAVKLDLTSSDNNPLTTGAWPFEATASYAKYDLKAKGNVSNAGKNVEIGDYEASFGGSSAHGQLKIALDGTRPSIKGTLISSKIDPDDLKPPTSLSGSNANPSAGGNASSNRMFSDEPLPLDALKSADAQIDIKVDEVVLSHASLKQIASTLSLSNGRLALSPVKAKLGDNDIETQFALDASGTPARLALSFKAPAVDLASLLKAAGTKEFLTGKGNVDFNITASGNSPHALASNSNGSMSLIVDSGTVSVQQLGEIASGLSELIAPGSSTSQIGLNCLVVRFDVKNGVAKDNGLLGDTTATTVAGSGGFNLGAETVDLTLHAKPKAVNTRGLLPPMRMSGSLSKPRFMLDAAGAVQNVIGLLTKSNANNSGVPDIITQAGQNSCLYTLSHAPAVNAPAQSPVQNAAASASTKIQKTGDKLLKGLFGH